VTAPALAQTSPDGHRVYVWQGRQFPSVTAILSGGVPKPFLPAWAAKAAAEYAIAHLDRLALLPPGAAVREVKRAPWTKRDTAADLGDLVHAAVEAHATGRPRPTLPAQAVPYLAAFDRFCADHDPGFLLAERTVFSRRYGYAGTLDAICVLGNRVTLLDVKTGRGVYPEACLQLAAYTHADFTADPDGATEQPLPTIQAGAVLHLRPGGYQLVAVPIGQAVLEAFLAARAVFCWATELAPAVLPTPLTTGPRPGGGHP
jgi:hypothetical protein